MLKEHGSKHTFMQMDVCTHSVVTGFAVAA